MFNHYFFYVLGISFFIIICGFAFALLMYGFIVLWEKYGTRTWICQSYDVIKIWYKYRYKKYDDINWNIVELLNKSFIESKEFYFKYHIYRRWWLSTFKRMMESNEYKQYLKSIED